ncbi:unnamed protein product [Caenorhabditis nigoni]
MNPKKSRWSQNGLLSSGQAGKRQKYQNGDGGLSRTGRTGRTWKWREIAPGIYRSQETKDAAKNATSSIGTTTFTTFEFTLEAGKVASLDNEHVISTLGSLGKCTFGSGSCQDGSSTWGPQETHRECQHQFIHKTEAIISQELSAITQMRIFSKFNMDLRRLWNSLEGCTIRQGYE